MQSPTYGILKIRGKCIFPRAFEERKEEIFSNKRWKGEKMSEYQEERLPTVHYEAQGYRAKKKKIRYFLICEI